MLFRLIIVNLYYFPPHSIWKRYVQNKCVCWDVHTISDNHDKNSIWIDHSPACRGFRWRVQCWFFLWQGQQIPFFLSLHQPQTFHEHCLCIFALQSFKCQLAESRGIEASRFKNCVIWFIYVDSQYKCNELAYLLPAHTIHSPMLFQCWTTHKIRWMYRVCWAGIGGILTISATICLTTKWTTASTRLLP